MNTASCKVGPSGRKEGVDSQRILPPLAARHLCPGGARLLPLPVLMTPFSRIAGRREDHPRDTSATGGSIRRLAAAELGGVRRIFRSGRGPGDWRRWPSTRAPIPGSTRSSGPGNAPYVAPQKMVFGRSHRHDRRPERGADHRRRYRGRPCAAADLLAQAEHDETASASCSRRMPIMPGPGREVDASWRSARAGDTRTAHRRLGPQIVTKDLAAGRSCGQPVCA